MILTIGLVIIKMLFRNGEAEFILDECQMTEDGNKVRTTFRTKGHTRWGGEVVISGTDFFWFGDGSSQIIRHQSSWDQSPEEVMKSIKGVK